MDLKFVSKFQPEKSPYQITGDFTKSLQPTKADLDKVGEWLAQRVRERTLAGTDTEGNPFAPYSPAYGKEKGSEEVNLYSANRASKGAQMDLFEHGPNHMLDSLKEQVEDSGSDVVLEVGILDSPQTAFRGRMLQEGWQPRGHVGRRYKKGKDKGKFLRKSARRPARPWLGASDEDKTEMRRLLEEEIAQRIGKGGE